MTSPLRARLSASALAANAREAVRRAGEHTVADLRRDAWGHGVEHVAAALAEAGARAAVVDVDADARMLVTGLGLTVTDAAPAVDARLVLGLPGGGGAPVLRVAGTVLSTKPLLAGEGVSYGYTHRASADTHVALVTGGYAQGIVRSLGNRVSVEIGGALHRLVGRVAMDVCVVDIGGAPVRPGDEVVFFGGDGPARDGLTDWAEASGWDAAELVTAVALRAVREVAP